MVRDYWYHDHWVTYPATSALYVPPCVYRIIPPDTSHIDFINPYDYNNREQYRLVEQFGKYGIINRGDTLIIPMLYDSLIRITNTEPKVFIAVKYGKYGLLNDEHEVVVPFAYDRIHLMTNGQYFGMMSSILSVEQDGKQGLMRLDGSVELSCKYEFIDNSCRQTDCPKTGVQYYVGLNGKTGYINRDETVAIDFKYDALNAKGFSALIKAENNGKVGLMDTLENFIVPQVYEQLYNENMWRFANLTAFKQDGKWGLMYGDYSDMKVVLENQFDSVFCDYAFEDHFIIINKGKWGLADTLGKVVIQPQYEAIDAMEDGTFAYKKDGRWGFMSKTGLVHCSPRYDEIYENDKNWCLVRKGDGYGFCKTSGEQIAAPIYDIPIWDDYVHWGELLYRGTIALSKRDGDECKLGVIDSNGTVLVPFEYGCYDELVYNFGRTLIAIKNDKQVLLAPNGKEVYLGDYDEIDRNSYGYNDDYFFLKKGDKVGLVSPDGKLISKAKYESIDFLSVSYEGLEESDMYFLVKLNGKFGVLDSMGRTVLDPIYDELAMKDNQYFELVTDRRVRLYNIKTKEYAPFSSLDGYQFNGHVGAFYGAGGNTVFIDAVGNLVNEKTYDYIWLQSSNYFKTEKNGNYGMCDSLGNELFASKFSKIKFWDGEFGAGKIANSYCFFDRNGDTLVGYRYQKVKGVFEDYVCVRVKGKFGVVTKKGETVIEPILQTKVNFDLFIEYGLTTAVIDYKVGVMNTDMELIITTKFDSVSFVEVYNKVYVLCFIQGIIALHDGEGALVSELLFNKYEYDNAGILFLSDGLNWYQLVEDGELVEVRD